MANNNRKVKGNDLQRVLFARKGIRKKIYKKVTQSFLQMGIEQLRIDEVIEQFNQGNLRVDDKELLSDLLTLKRFDADIERISKKIQERKQTPASEEGKKFE